MKNPNNKIFALLFCWVLLFILLVPNCFANEKSDSLQHMLQETMDDSLRAKVMQELAWELKYSKPDSAEILALGALNLMGVNNLEAIKKTPDKNHSNVSHILNTLGAISYVKSEHAQALNYYFTALSIDEALGNKKGMSSAMGNIGVIYKSQSDFTQALEYYLKAAKILEELGNKKSIATTYNNIGSIYLNQSNFLLALDYYLKSLKLKEELGSKQGLAHSYTNLGQLYCDLYNSDESIKNSLGSWAAENPQLLLDTSFYYHDKAIEICKALNIKFGLVFNYTGLGKVYAQKEEFSNSIKYYKQSLSLAHSIGAIKEEASTHQNIAQIYNKWAVQEFSTIKPAERINYLKKSIEHLEKHQELQDSLFNKESTKQLAEMRTKYEANKKEKEIVLLKTEKDIQELKLTRNRIISIALFVSFVLVLILAVVIFKGYKKKQVINELLEKQNEEKTAMMKEIHHRVKNNLQVVNSLLKLQSYEVEDKKIVSMFEECQNRVLSMALIHEKMYRSDDLTHIDVPQHFTLLIRELIADYKLETEIQLDLLMEEVKFGMKTLVPLGLIINEIITNSLKYAFKNRDNGIIKVHLKKLKKGGYQLEMADNGIGIEPGTASNGFGTELIQLFVNQLEGKIERLDTPGTELKIMFQNIDNA